MKSCIVTGQYFAPGETFVNRHIEHLFGGDTCVVTARRQGDDPLGKPIFIRRTGKAPLGDKLLWAPRAIANTARYGTSRAPQGQLKRGMAAFLRDHGTQVMLAEFGTQALALYPLANELNIPIFTYFRGTDASKSLEHKRIQKAYRKMMPHLAGVFSVSQFLLDNLARFDIRHPYAHVIPSGVNVSLFQPGEKTPGSFIAVGRLVEKKHPLVTIDAFAEAAKDHPHARLDVIGDGPLLDTCKARAADLGLSDRITFHGALPHDAVRERLAVTETFLQHSVTAKDGNTEGLPTAIQEALAAGCIVVSTRHAGIPEAVEDGVNGYLVEEHDQSGFAAKIAQVLATGDTSAMTAAARATAVERFDNAKLLSLLETRIRERISG